VLLLITLLLQTEQCRSRGYEALDPIDLESLRAPPRPTEYVGLTVQGSTARVQGRDAPRSQGPAEQRSVDQYGYLEVVPDPDNDNQLEV